MQNGLSRLANIGKEVPTERLENTKEK